MRLAGRHEDLNGRQPLPYFKQASQHERAQLPAPDDPHLDRVERRATATSGERAMLAPGLWEVFLGLSDSARRAMLGG